MSQENHDQSVIISELLDKVHSLEMRIGQIEGQMETAVQGLAPVHRNRYQPEQANNLAEEELMMDKGLIESNIFDNAASSFSSVS